jgi:hypothetical protein
MLCPRDLTCELYLSIYIYIHTLYYHTHEKLLTPTGYLTAARTDNTTIIVWIQIIGIAMGQIPTVSSTQLGLKMQEG